MNKKVIMFLALILCTLSIMGIAVWGTLPENSNQARVDSIVIEVYDEINGDGDKFKDVKDLVTLSNNQYEIAYVINPDQAESNIHASSNQNGVSVQVDQEAQVVYVFFDSNKIGSTVTIKIWDSNTQKFDELTLWFKNPGEVEVPDLD
ncbi:MAG: hypothetical protein IH571_07385 [Acholeplasmataceae bacterium]|nr:hypothetical protein [Acholeplasmataceae bacterium]